MKTHKGLILTDIQKEYNKITYRVRWVIKYKLSV